MKPQRKTILYIAMSLDGFIAKPNDNLDFLSIVEQEGEDYGYYDFLKSVDTMIMGRKTYDWLMTQVTEFPYLDLESYIITRNPRPSNGKLHFYSGELEQLVLNLKEEGGKAIFINGGAEIVHQLLKNKLIDEIILSIIPILLGEGIRLFNEGFPEQQLQLIDSRNFEKGLVQLHYKTIQK